MKRTLFLVAMAAICSLITISCKNTNQNDNQMSANEVEAQKIEYGEEIMAVIDSLSNSWISISAESKIPLNLVLTEKEKMLKPDFLFDPKAIDTLVSREQKVCALAMLIIDRTLLLAYDMPVEETDEAISKLFVDVNFPITVEDLKNKDDDAVSKCVAKTYNHFKESGELATFWLFNAQGINEIEYIIAQNPDLYLSKVSKKDWKNFNTVWDLYCAASRTLKNYDPEMAKLNELLHRDCVYVDGYTSDVYDDINTAIPFYHIAKEQFIFRRNNMLNY